MSHPFTHRYKGGLRETLSPSELFTMHAFNIPFVFAALLALTVQASPVKRAISQGEHSDSIVVIVDLHSSSSNDIEVYDQLVFYLQYAFSASVVTPCRPNGNERIVYVGCLM